MSKIVECVPNFSEGRTKEVIEAIATALGNADGCTLLDVDAGASTNRTVYTFVGSPSAVMDGAINGARAAYHLIDMTKHTGEHPRMGALDVCPFIPVQNVTMAECIQLAQQFGERLSRELDVPVYLYGESASKESRKLLSNIRKGEYEGLSAKIVDPEWAPDYGDAEFVPSWGATAVGARKFLVAYNINLLGTKEQAHRIALDLRENGRGDKPGILKCVQAIGWYLDEANLAQVSMNILDFDVTPLHVAYEEAQAIARSLDLAIIGSQIVGVVPLSCLLTSADYYMEKENLFLLDEDQKLRLVVNRLGLNSIGSFIPKEKVIEYMIQDENEGILSSMEIKDFIYSVSSRSPTPGGGSVSALVASLGAALGSMVGLLSHGNKKFQENDKKMRSLIPALYKASKNLVPFIDADAAAFSEYMLALKLPKQTDDEISFRKEAMEKGLHLAIKVPLTVGQIVNSLWENVKEISHCSNTNCTSDLQVSVKCLETAVYGAYYNVITNLDNVNDENFKESTKKEIEDMLKVAENGCREVLAILKDRDD